MTVTGVLAVCLFSACASDRGSTAQAVPTLSEFATRLLGYEPVATSLPAAPPRAGGARHGAWSLRLRTHGCSPALVALVRFGEGETGLRCRGFHDCLSAIIAGLQSAGIRRRGAQLIRIDTVVTSPTAPSRRGDNGLRLRFEEHTTGIAEEPAIYTASILLLPDGDATTAAVLITKDVGDSYECFDAANLAFARFTEGLAG
jgi:hypothetical protein